MPRIEPRVVRRFENCSATETIAVKMKVSHCLASKQTGSDRERYQRNSSE